jgi:chromosome partition protein MukE
LVFALHGGNLLIEPPYKRLEEVIEDPAFPDVDLALRRGRHIDLDDSEWYSFLSDAQPFLETFYRRFGCELVKVTDGYFYLLPSGDRLGRRRLSRGEMLTGQGLALIFLDPATLRARGVIPVSQLIEILANIVGRQRLVMALNARKKQPRDERVAEENARTEIARALRGLEKLGFVTQLPDDMLRLRTPLMRLVDPVRGHKDSAEALSVLIARGEVTMADDETEDNE